MIGQETHDVQRKILAILNILNESSESLGGSVISHRLNEQGIELCERAVRYHLKIMDERGLTRIVGRRNGREITPQGLEEIRNALVFDKIGRLSARIEHLSYLTTFDTETAAGNIPVDISLFAREDFNTAVKIIGSVHKAGLSISNLVARGDGGEKLGEFTVPQGKTGLATVSSVLVNGLLLKYGIPSESRFVGLVQMKNYKPYCFTDFISYRSTTIDPLEMFITSRMTSVNDTVTTGNGRVLANFIEIPEPAKPAALTILQKLKTVNLCHSYMNGNTVTPSSEIPMSPNKTGILLFSGLNPIAAAAEKGINILNHPMGGTMDIRQLKSPQSL